jgi:Zn-dependent peptidase ImmA (M78 family)
MSRSPSLTALRDMSSLAKSQGLTLGEQTAVPGPVRDPRADALRRRYHELFGGEELPVPVESIAEDLLGLAIHEQELNDISGLLYPEERQIFVNASDVPARRRFTIAHELGHWVCQCLEGRGAPVMCRAQDVSPDTNRTRTLEREANVFGAELLMPEAVVRKHAADRDAPELFGVSGLAFHWRLFSFDLAERPLA